MARETTEVAVQCCACRRVRSANGWLRLALHASQRVSHGYCPPCLDEALRAVHRLATGFTAGPPSAAIPPA